MTGPYASRVLETSLSAISRPGWRHAPQTSRRNVSPQEPCVVEPAGQAFDPALGPGVSRAVGGDAGPLGALTTHGPPDERRQRGQVPGDAAGGLARIPLCESVPYGTISAEVVTHRRLLSDWSRFPARVYDETTSHHL